MKKIFSAKYGWVVALILIVLVNFVAAAFHFRIDLTSEKRFSLSTPTKRLVRSLEEPIDITVLLDGKLPAGFRKLENSSRDMLREFKELGRANIRFRFQRPGEGVEDTTRFAIYDSLSRLGIHPTNVKAQVKSGESMEEQMVFAGAVVKYQDRVLGVDLLQGQSAVDGLNSLNNAESLLEYKFADAIHKITQDSVPVVGYLVGNGEPLTYSMVDLIDHTLKPNYGFGFVHIDSFPTIPAAFKAMVVVKPTRPFSDAQKLKLDQFVMNGGRLIWMVDRLYASLDSLQRSEGSFIAFDMGLNLDDLFFKYGVRINPDLVQDLNCAQIPTAYGEMGGKPQIQLVPYPFFPLLGSGGASHPISQNLDYVMSQFPSSIDTVKAPGIRKTPLLATSDASRVLSTPAKVEWSAVKNEEDLKTFNKPPQTIAYLLEGRFSSLYANRISTAMADTLANVYGKPFLATSAEDNQMVVVADGDIVANAVSQKEGPLTMGRNMYTGYQYANKDFFLNCLEWLTDRSGILELRGKDYSLRLLDKKKVEEERAVLQLLNIGLPVGLVLIFAVIYQYLRKRRYA